MEIITNKLHEKIFPGQYNYNPTILKGFSVSLKARNEKRGEDFKVGVNFYPEAYTHQEAAEKAAAQYLATMPEYFTVIEARPVATRTI
jgi:hypothetical protein